MNPTNVFDALGCQRRSAEFSPDFAQIEWFSGFELPQAYCDFLTFHQGFSGYIGQHWLELWSYEEVLDLNGTYRIHEFLEKEIAIGSNGGGELIVMNKNGECVLLPAIGLDSPTSIGNTFLEMITNLRSGKNWFE
jgi:hypothetical protein